MEALAGGAAALLSAASGRYSVDADHDAGPASGAAGDEPLQVRRRPPSCSCSRSSSCCGPAALSVPPDALWRFALSGVLGLAIADTAYLSALKHIGPTLTAIVYETSGIFTCLLGVALLDERLTAGEIGAVALVIGGVLLASSTTPPAHVARGHRLRGGLYGLFAAAFHCVRAHRQQVGVRRRSPRSDGTTGFRGRDDRRLHAHGRGRGSGSLVFGVVTGSLARPDAAAPRGGGLARELPSRRARLVRRDDHDAALAHAAQAGIASVLLSMTPIFTIPIAWRMLNHRPDLARDRGRGDRARRRVAAFAGQPFLTMCGIAGIFGSGDRRTRRRHARGARAPRSRRRRARDRRKGRARPPPARDPRPDAGRRPAVRRLAEAGSPPS